MTDAEMTNICAPITGDVLNPVRPVDALDELNYELGCSGGRIDVDRNLACTQEEVAEELGIRPHVYKLARTKALRAVELKANESCDVRFLAAANATAGVVFDYTVIPNTPRGLFDAERELDRTLLGVLPGSSTSQRRPFGQALGRFFVACGIDSSSRRCNLPSPFEMDRGPLDLETETAPVQTLLALPNGAPFMPRGVVASFNATGGVGKTFLALELAVAIVLRETWLGRYQVAENVPNRVLAAIAEEDHEECRRRLRAACDTLGLGQEERKQVADNVIVYGLRGQPTPLMARDGAGVTDHHRALVERLFQGGPWGLVILDPQARFTGGFPVEKSNEDATVFVQTALEPLTKVPGNPTVLVLGHSSKESNRSGKADARGVTGQRDAYRWAALMYKADGGIIFEHDKSNYTALDGCRLLERLPCGLLRDAGAADGERVKSRRTSRSILKDAEKDELKIKRDEHARNRAMPQVLAFINDHAPVTARRVQSIGGNRRANDIAVVHAVKLGHVVNEGTGRAAAYFLTDIGKQELVRLKNLKDEIDAT